MAATTANTEATTTTTVRPHLASGVLFDIDGTLADSWKLGFDATRVVLSDYDPSVTVTEELYHEGTKYSTPERLARHVGLTPERDGDDYARVGDSLAERFDRLYVGLVSKETAGFYEGIEDLVLSLPSSREGVRIGALTNACVAYAHAVLAVNSPSTTSSSSPLYESFGSIHGADTVPSPKPSPAGLLLCCRELNLPPDRCVYVGDSPSDAVAAKEAGMTAVGVLWGSHGEEAVYGAPFDYVCESVEGLRRLLIG